MHNPYAAYEISRVRNLHACGIRYLIDNYTVKEKKCKVIKLFLVKWDC